MQVTLVILKDQTTLIAQTSQLDMEPRVHLFEPYIVSGVQKLTLAQWPKPSYSEEKHILFHTDSLLTVCEPTTALRDAYLKKVKRVKEYDEYVLKQEEENNKVLLQEDEQSVMTQDPTDDDYEAQYVEDGIGYWSVL